MIAADGIDVTIFRALHLVTRQVIAGIERHLQAVAGVSFPEYQILNAVETSLGRRARPREIGEILAWEKSRTSHQVARMEKRGLLERTDCPADMRGTWIALTRAGARAVRAAKPAYVAAIEEHLGGGLTTQERRALAHHLVAIGRAAPTAACPSEVASLEESLSCQDTTL